MIKTFLLLVIMITLDLSVIYSYYSQAYGVRAIWRHYENMKDLVNDIKNGDKNDNNMDWDKFRDSTIYKETGKDVRDCLNLANKVGQKLGDYEVVRCFENANYLTDKYSGDGENQSQSQANVSQSQANVSQSQANVSQSQANVSQSQANVGQTQNTASSNNSSGTCDSSYPAICITPYPAKLGCFDIPYRNFTVLAPDPYGLDSDGDGLGCEG